MTLFAKQTGHNYSSDSHTIEIVLIYLIKIKHKTSATLFQLKCPFHYLIFESAGYWLGRYRQNSRRKK